MKGDYKSALSDIEQALKLAPKDPENLFIRGFVYRKQGQLDKAMVDLNEAIRLEPDFGEAYRERGEVWTAKGQPDKAMADLNQAIKLVPDDHEALFRRGRAFAVKGDLDKAVADYDAAIKLDPAFAERVSIARWSTWRKTTWRRPWPTTGRPSGPTRERPTTSRLGGEAKTRDRRAKAVDRLEELLQKAKAEAQVHSQRGAKLHRDGDSPRPSPSTTRRWNSIRVIPRSTTTAAWRIARRMKWRRRLPTTRKRSASIRSTFPPMPTAATSFTCGTTTTGRWPISTRFSNSIRRTPTRKEPGDNC